VVVQLTHATMRQLDLPVQAELGCVQGVLA
jgi:hypothetical protein